MRRTVAASGNRRGGRILPPNVSHHLDREASLSGVDEQSAATDDRAFPGVEAQLVATTDREGALTPAIVGRLAHQTDDAAIPAWSDACATLWGAEGLGVGWSFLQCNRDRPGSRPGRDRR